MNACVVCFVCKYVSSHFHAWVCGELRNDVKLFLHELSIVFYSGRSLFLNLKLAIQASLASQLAPRTRPPSPLQAVVTPFPIGVWRQSQDPILVQHYPLHVFTFFFFPTKPSFQNSIWFFWNYSNKVKYI